MCDGTIYLFSSSMRMSDAANSSVSFTTFLAVIAALLLQVCFLLVFVLDTFAGLIGRKSSLFVL